MFVYPHPDPVAISLGPLAVRWYGLMYLVGFVAAWWLARRRAAGPRSTWTPTEVATLEAFYAPAEVVPEQRLRIVEHPLDPARRFLSAGFYSGEYPEALDDITRGSASPSRSAAG